MGSLPPPPPRPALRPTLRWGLGDAVLTLAVALVVGLVATEIAIGVTHLKAQSDGSYPETIPLLVAAVGGQYGAWLAMMVLTSVRKGLGTLRADFGLVVDIVSDWWLIPVGFAGSLVAGILLEPITNLVNQTPQQIVQDLDTAHGAKLAIIAVTAVLVAPVVEELFFRGLLLRALQRRFSAPVAVAISAVAFGALHLLGDVHAGAVLPALVALGMLSGILAVRTGNLSRSILLHAGFNLLAVVSVLRR
jgi:membrane protease YdiL (CAAX protease family)